MIDVLIAQSHGSRGTQAERGELVRDRTQDQRQSETASPAADLPPNTSQSRLFTQIFGSDDFETGSNRSGGSGGDLRNKNTDKFEEENQTHHVYGKRAVKEYNVGTYRPDIANVRNGAKPLSDPVFLAFTTSDEPANDGNALNWDEVIGQARTPKPWMARGGFIPM